MERSLRGRRSLPLRIWHWLDVIAIFGLLGTGFLRKTVMGWRTMAGAITSGLEEAGTTVAPEVARKIAVEIRTPMWDLHYVFGFLLAGLLALRLVVAVLPGRSSVLPDLQRELARPDRSWHHVLVKAGYVVFYALTAYMVASGVLMYFKGALGLSKDLVGALKSAHELLLYFFGAFVVLHVVGVFVAELRGSPGLVSDMIHGGDHAPAARAPAAQAPGAPPSP